MLRPDPRI